MRNRILAALLSLMLVLALLPASALAETTVSVYIGSSSTAVSMTLADAITKTAGTDNIKIMLKSDVKLTETLNLTKVGGEVTLDLNGYELSADGLTVLKVAGTSEKNIKITGGTVNEDRGDGKKLYYGQIMINNGDADDYAVEVASDYAGTISLYGYLKVEGNIKYAGSKTMKIQDGDYYGDIENSGSGTIEFKKSFGSKIPKQHTGDLKNTGSGKISITDGSFNKMPDSSFLKISSIAKDGNLWTVSKLTAKNAANAGYVAGSSGYASLTKDYNGTLYKTIADAADARSEIHLLKDVDLNQSGFAFTWAKKATDPLARQFYLEGHTYQGSITDDVAWQNEGGESPLSERNKTIIDGDKDSHNTTNGRGTANLTSVITNVVLAVQNKADVTVATGSAAGIDVDATSTLTLNGGTYTGTITVAEGGKLTLTGGTYDEDVTQYCAEGYVASRNANGTYTVLPYAPDSVGDTTLNEIESEGDTTGSVDAAVIADGKQVIAEEVANSVDAELTGTTEDVTIAPAEKKTAIQKLIADKQVKLDTDDKIVPYVGDGDVTVTLIKEPYLEVKVTSLTEETTKKELAVDITPKYNLLATTDTGDSTKSVTVSTGNPLTVNKDTVVTLQLPGGFAQDGDKLLVKHTKSDGTEEYYTGKVSLNVNKIFITFTTHGFSPFVITDDIAATIGYGEDRQIFPSLQAAVDAAKDGDTINLYKNGEIATVNRTVRFTVDPSAINPEDPDYLYTIKLGAGSTRYGTGNVWNIVYTAPTPSISPFPSETPTETEEPEEKPTELPRTGDCENTAVWLALMGIGLAGMLLLYRERRKAK